MSVSSGFFDAVLEGNVPDRSYNANDFVGYFNQIIGSGVAIAGNANSLKVSVSGTDAIVAAGYLFIEGYWLKNDASYTISLASAASGDYAIVARLSKANRTITLQYEAQAETYTDCLVLATLTKPAVGSLGSLVDTRSNTTLCGTLQSLGTLNDAINTALATASTLSTQIAAFQTTLNNQALQIAAKFDEVDAIEAQKVAQANALIASTESAVIGSIQHSIQRPGSKWLKCDGSYVDKTTYGTLVTLLQVYGTPFPTPTEVQIAQGTDFVSNFVIIDGYVFYYIPSTQTLQKMSLSTGQISSITVTGLSGFNTIDQVYITKLSTGCITLAQISNEYCYVSNEVVNSATTELSFTNKGYNAIHSDVYPNVIYREDSYVQAQYNYALQLTFASASGYSIQFRIFNSVTTIRLCYGNSNSNKVPFGVIPKLGYLPSFNDNFVYVEFDSVTVDNTVYHQLTLKGYNTDLIYSIPAVSDTDFDSNTVLMLDSIPVKCGTQFIYGARIVNRQLQLYASSLSQFQLCKKTFAYLLPTNAKIFTDAACYLSDKSIFVMFVGTGFFFATDLLNPNTYGYFDTVDALGEIVSDAWCSYDSVNKKFYLSGKNTSSVTKFFQFDLTLWSYSDTGAWLPIVHDGAVDGYIKALE